MADLRGYQERAITDLRSSLAGGRRRVVLYLPTGGGKTVVAAGIIRQARAKGKRVAFVCNRVELVLQTVEHLRAAGIDCGVVQSLNSHSEWLPVLVCSIQTTARRGFPEVDLIIVDEAHGVAGSKDYRRMLQERNGVRTIGLTATPFARGMGRHDEDLGGALFEEIIVAATIEELIRDGYLVDLDVYAPSEPDLSGVKIVAGDYHEGQLEEATNKPSLVGDIVEQWLKLGGNKQTVCFATSIAHSKHIVERFNAVGVSAEHVDAYTDPDSRREIIKGFRRGEFRILSNCSLLSEGFDAPATEVMILARPTKSLIRWIQMAGRVLRPAPGKDRALMLDHSGTAKRLGFPTDPLPLVLDDGKPKKSAAQKEKPEALPKVCASCTYLKPAKVHKCPMCGFEPKKVAEVETQDGSLALLKRKNTKERIEDKQSVYSQLLTYASQHGYQDGWVGHKYRAYFGVWPRGLHGLQESVTPQIASWVRSQQIRHAKAKKKEAANATACV